MRRLTIAIVLVLGAFTFLDAQTAPFAAASVTQIADQVFAAIIERYPESGTFMGAPGARNDRTFDNTPEARRAWDARVDMLFARLRAIDARALAGRPEQVTYGFVEQALQSEVRRRVCHTELWGVDHMNGWQFYVPSMLTRQPVATPADRRAALARLRQ